MNNGGLRSMGIRKYTNEKKTLVSIITVVYNGENYLEMTIRSVIEQTYDNIEYIVIDGGSTDKTVDIIKKYSDQIDYWISEPDKGIADAFNKGISLSTGDIIGIINADDWYEPNTIQIIVNNLKPFPAVYCGHMNLYSPDGANFLKLHKSRPDRLSQTMRVAHPSTFVHRLVYDNVGTYSIDYKSAMDYDFFLRARSFPFEIIIVNQVLSNMRLGGISKDLPMILKEELKVKNSQMGKKVEHFAWYLASMTAYVIKSISYKIYFKFKNNAKAD